MAKVKDAAARTPRLAILCGTLLAACALAAPSAQAASAPTAALGPSDPQPEGSAYLHAYVNPHGASLTTCKFEYGPQAGAYDHEAPCADPEAPEVSAHLQGLTPGATYHYRLLAANSEGPGSSEDATFRAASEPSSAPCPNEALRSEQHSAFLPDCRAWEMVSPPDKNGGDVMADTARVRVAEDGGAVEYSSLSGFAEPVGGGVATEYMSVRGPGGWSTHAITPPQKAFSFEVLAAGLEPKYEGDLSPDLDKGVTFAWKPLSGEDPDVAEIANLYLREGLRDSAPGTGAYRLITACPLCASPFSSSLTTKRPIFIDATPDYGKVLFESELNLAPGASGGAFKLYEWDHGTVRLAGVLPGGAPASESGAGSGTVGSSATYTHASISDDGSKVFFTAPAGGTTNVYMRLNGTETVQLNVSETGLSDPGSAHYVDASATGSRVFFTSPQALTAGAPNDGSVSLYMYDTTKPDSAPDNLTYLSPDNEPADFNSNVVNRVAGASADGSVVYFADVGQLVSGTPAPKGLFPLFVWREGQPLTYIHMLTLDDQRDLSFDSSPALGGKYATVSPSGDLVYLSDEPVGPDGQSHGSCPARLTHACFELYVYSAARGELRCASCAPDGSPPPTGGDALTMLQGSVGGSARPRHLNRPLSEDGRYAFFTTAAALVPTDTNGRLDAYAYDTETGRAELLSSGTDPGDSYFLETSPDGKDAIFATRERLIGSDTDNNYDLYDARVGGGFPEPAPGAAPCAGEEACRSSSPPSPPPASGLGSLLQGPGNPPASRPRPCPKGTRAVRRAGKRRCLKAAHHHRHHHSHRGGSR